ncbi:MAG: alginate O-acetyltransferase AlgX-related protein [Haloechinothrix sp.]
MRTSTKAALPPVHEAWLPRDHALHRPRHGRRQITALVCAAVFFAPPLLAQVLGVSAAEIENHRLASFPRPTDGWGFFTGLSAWATDHLVFRGEAIAATDAVSRGMFGEPPSLGTGPQQSGPLVVDKQKARPRPIPVPQVVEGEDDWLYLGAEIESRCNQENALDRTFEQLHRLRDGVEATGRTFVLVVAPDKLTIVPEHVPDRRANRACISEATDEFWRRVRAVDFIVDLRGPLRSWGDQLGTPVYPRLDAHWTDEGGVLMTRALAEAAQPGISDEWAIEPGEPWTVPADLPPLMGRKGDADGRYYMLKPDGVHDRTREIDELFRTPLRINSGPIHGMVGKKVGLLGDSFTIRALRYLAASFSDMTVLHTGTVLDDKGIAAAEMLADREVVAIEAAERSLLPKYSAITSPEVVDTIIKKLAEHPIG